jgi:PAS domain S-box-containing protein
MSTHRRSALFIILGLLITGWLGAYAFTLWQLRQAALDNGIETAATHARNFEKHLTQTLEMVELAAVGLAPGQSTDSISAHFSEQMNDALRKTPYLRSLSLVDEQGKVLASTSPNNVGSVLAMRSFFPDITQDSLMIHVGALWQGRDLADGVAETPLAENVRNNRPGFIPVLRRIDNGDSRHWIVGALNPEYFKLHFTQLLSADEGHTQILRHDGLLLLSSNGDDLPGQGGAAGQVTEWLTRRDAGSLPQTLPDGSPVLTAYRVSSRFPVLVAVHIDQNAILERWRDDARHISLVVLPVLFALSAAAFLVWRRQRKLEERERELSSQRKLAASVFAATNNAVFLTNPQGDIVTANPAFERITGYSVTEVLGRNPRLLASGHHDSDFYRQMWQGILKNGHWDGEIINKRKDGKLFYGILNINTVLDDNGQLKHYVGVTVDITERKQYEGELLLAKERAEAASLAKTTFLATMSHELRTPMNGVLGMTEVMLRSPLDEKQRRQLGIVRDSAVSLLGILNQILDFSKIESHNLQLEHTSLDINSLIHDLTALFAPAAEAKGVALYASPFPELPPDLFGDPLRLRQILTNLLNNAVKFTRAGKITVDAELRDGRVIITVTDTGIGIAEDKQQQIFEAFTQADGSHTREYGGTGLGLSISRRLAEAMGGSLTVDSTPGRGSQFTLNIPARFS